MDKIIEFNSADIFPLIVELLNEGKSVNLVVNGTSMLPFLREHIDSVELIKKDFDKIRIGDIIVARWNSGSFVMHRVVFKNNDKFYLMGDAQHWIEGPGFPENVVACVTS